MNEIVAIIIVVFGILQLILFFKIWGMTNDIRDIRKKYLNEDKIHPNTPIVNNNTDHSEGTLVVELKTEKQMRLGELLKNGNYKCYSNGVFIGEFAPTDFMEFDQWKKEIYKK